MLETENNPNPKNIVDPSRLLRFVLAKFLGRIANTRQINKKRSAFEKTRKSTGADHVVEYFHQLDDPYSHLTAQVLARFAARYDVKIVPYLIRASGGKHQPELQKLATWARRDVELVAPHYGLNFPACAGVVPDSKSQQAAAAVLAGMSPAEFIENIEQISQSNWQGQSIEQDHLSDSEVGQKLDQG